MLLGGVRAKRVDPFVCEQEGARKETRNKNDDDDPTTTPINQHNCVAAHSLHSTHTHLRGQLVLARLDGDVEVGDDLGDLLQRVGLDGVDVLLLLRHLLQLVQRLGVALDARLRLQLVQHLLHVVCLPLQDLLRPVQDHRLTLDRGQLRLQGLVAAMQCGDAM